MKGNPPVSVYFWVNHYGWTHKTTEPFEKQQPENLSMEQISLNVKQDVFFSLNFTHQPWEELLPHDFRIALGCSNMKSCGSCPGLLYILNSPTVQPLPGILEHLLLLFFP